MIALRVFLEISASRLLVEKLVYAENKYKLQPVINLKYKIYVTKIL